MSQSTWKTVLAERIPAALGDEIDVFETQIALRRQGKIDDALFAETRLRRGVYGQRYDNGQRHDGVATRALAYPCGDLKKGPNTVWDAPGMQRIKIPMGRVTCEQLEVLADLAEEYADDILHVTTRQDIQFHFVHIDDTPDLMRRLAAVGITTREACGNVVRNVTACQFAGVCNDQSFDVTPHAQALADFLLGHRDTQGFGRKFKIAFSGCHDHACGLAHIHDIGAVAVIEGEGGERRRGFTLYVGGGLGAVPHRAQVLDPFVPEDELLPVCQAVCRVFSRLGERKNRARARLKFVVAKLGIEEFREIVGAERAQLPRDEAWTAHLGDREREPGVADEAPLRPGVALADDLVTIGAGPGAGGAGFATWRRTNTRRQAQPGYAVATVRLPLGDLTGAQARALAAIARRFTGDTIRLTVEQNAVIRWVSEADLPALYRALAAADLADPGAGTIADITACPGTDTCKLGISASRGLARALEADLHALGSGEASGEASGDLKPEADDDDARALRIKTSGCFNSCGQHHIADIGYLGVSRNVKGRRVAHFQLVVGGKWRDNGGAFGLAIGAFPAKRIPEVNRRLIALWLSERQPGEPLQAFIQRVGRARLKDALDDLRAVPEYADDPSFYVDWGDAREYTIGDMGVGECAGEVVSYAQFGLADSEREVFEAQLALDAGDAPSAAKLAYRAMLDAALALIRVEHIDVGEDPDTIVSEFRTRFDDTGLFHDPFAGGKFARFLFATHASPPNGVDADTARKHVEEAQLFIEAAHACYDRMQEVRP